jgi:hypothetical protein
MPERARCFEAEFVSLYRRAGSHCLRRSYAVQTNTARRTGSSKARLAKIESRPEIYALHGDIFSMLRSRGP